MTDHPVTPPPWLAHPGPLTESGRWRIAKSEFELKSALMRRRIEALEAELERLRVTTLRTETERASLAEKVHALANQVIGLRETLDQMKDKMGQGEG